MRFRTIWVCHRGWVLIKTNDTLKLQLIHHTFGLRFKQIHLDRLFPWPTPRYLIIIMQTFDNSIYCFFLFTDDFDIIHCIQCFWFHFWSHVCKFNSKWLKLIQNKTAMVCLKELTIDLEWVIWVCENSWQLLAVTHFCHKVPVVFPLGSKYASDLILKSSFT